MAIETKTVTVTNVPTEELEYVRALAVRDRCEEQSDAATMRYALVEYAKLVPLEYDDEGDPAAAESTP